MGPLVADDPSIASALFAALCERVPVGDTVYLADWGRRRTTVWTADGRLLDSIPAADALRGAYPRARDAAGQLYFEVPPEAGRDGSGNRDSNQEDKNSFQPIHLLPGRSSGYFLRAPPRRERIEVGRCVKSAKVSCPSPPSPARDS